MKASREVSPFGLRMPEEIKEKVRKSAEKNGRSLNTEILMRLARSFENEVSSKQAA